MPSVLFDFTAEESLELSVRVGELVEIVWEGSDGDTGDGWIKVKNIKGCIGFVPKDYLESIPVQKSHSSPISHQVHEGSLTDSTPNSQHDHLPYHNSFKNALDFTSDSNLIVANRLNYSEDALAHAVEVQPTDSDIYINEYLESTSRPTSSQIQNNSIIFGRNGEIPSTVTLYDLAAESNFLDDIFDPQSIDDLLYRRESGSESNRPNSRLISANNFVKMIGNNNAALANYSASPTSITRPHSQTHSSPGPATRTDPNRTHQSSPVMPRNPIHNESVDLTSVEPVLSTAAVRGDFDELLQRMHEYFEQLSRHSSADAENLISASDVLVSKLSEAVKTYNTLMDNMLELSDSLETERTRQLITAKNMRNQQFLEKAT